MKRITTCLLFFPAIAGLLSAQGGQSFYVPSNVTGQLVKTATVNLLQLAQTAQASVHTTDDSGSDPSKSVPLLRGPARTRTSIQSIPTVNGLASVASAFSGFNGLTNFDQRNANNGNQFNVEPPNPSIAVGNGFVLQGVNNAVQVYTPAGSALLPAVVSSNQLFNVSPAIIRSTGVNGVFPTDMRVFYDPGISRWFVAQRAQDNDAGGGPLNSSHIYLAVSQTSDPTGVYNIYTMDTTDAANFNCPCYSDYIQLGADQYGFYISANEYNTFFPQFVDASILMISKNSLSAGATNPTMLRFVIPMTTGYEFTISPASVPPGGSNFLGAGGIEYFLSTQGSFSFDTNVALWAMVNTSAINLAQPNVFLTQTLVPTEAYVFPDVANQQPGPTPLGSSMFEPLEFLDGNDSRMLNVVYAGGRLFGTFATSVVDASTNRSAVGGAYVILSPAYRGTTLAAQMIRQGYISMAGRHVLRPSIAVNAQGVGAVGFSVSGSDIYPSAGFLPISVTSTGSAVQIAAFGSAPEDGFSGYPGGIARWGDYSTAVTAPDGTIWITTEYIPNLPRTPSANWGTFVMHYVP